MVSGSDEHGTPILIAADEAGLSPQELADRNHRLIVEDLAAWASPTTSTPAPRPATTTRVVQELFSGSTRTATSSSRRRNGAISPDRPDLPDRYIEGTCPICGYDGARGDQCDNCGNQLDPHDLIDPRRRSTARRRSSSRPSTSSSTCRRWPTRCRRGSTSARRPVCGGQRHPVQPKHPEEIRPRAMTRDIDWGIAVPLEGWRRTPPRSSTSG